MQKYFNVSEHSDAQFVCKPGKMIGGVSARGMTAVCSARLTLSFRKSFRRDRLDLNERTEVDLEAELLRQIVIRRLIGFRFRLSNQNGLHFQAHGLQFPFRSSVEINSLTPGAGAPTKGRFQRRVQRYKTNKAVRIRRFLSRPGIRETADTDKPADQDQGGLEQAVSGSARERPAMR